MNKSDHASPVVLHPQSVPPPCDRALDEVDACTLGEYTDDDYEALYAAGHGLYVQGQYQEASQVFAVLVILKSLDTRFLLALAGSLQMLGRYERAIENYATVMMIDSDDPRPLMHTCECLIRLGRSGDALGGLQLVLDEYNLEAYPQVKKKVLGLMALIQRQT